MKPNDIYRLSQSNKKISNTLGVLFPRNLSIGKIYLPTGLIFVCDPFGIDEYDTSLDKGINPGVYQFELTIVNSERALVRREKDEPKNW